MCQICQIQGIIWRKPPKRPLHLTRTNDKSYKRGKKHSKEQQLTAETVLICFTHPRELSQALSEENKIQRLAFNTSGAFGTAPENVIGFSVSLQTDQFTDTVEWGAVIKETTEMEQCSIRRTDKWLAWFKAPYFHLSPNPSHGAPIIVAQLFAKMKWVERHSLDQSAITMQPTASTEGDWISREKCKCVCVWRGWFV